MSEDIKTTAITAAGYIYQSCRRVYCGCERDLVVCVDCGGVSPVFYGPGTHHGTGPLPREYCGLVLALSTNKEVEHD